MTLILDAPSDLVPYVGKLLGIGPWLAIDQAMIDRFADVTGDRNWIHIDTERAAREMPDGKTIAHGCLTLSLLAALSAGMYQIRQRKSGINYGYDRVRFMAPVQAGSRIRCHQTLEAVEPISSGAKLTIKSTVEIEHVAKPAVIAMQIILVLV